MHRREFLKGLLGTVAGLLARGKKAEAQEIKGELLEVEWSGVPDIGFVPLQIDGEGSLHLDGHYAFPPSEVTEEMSADSVSLSGFSVPEEFANRLKEVVQFGETLFGRPIVFDPSLKPPRMDIVWAEWPPRTKEEKDA